MEFIGILFALFFALIITSIFSFVVRRTGPWSGFWVFFILLFFISLGAGEWAAPRGPVAWGYYWAPGLIAALIFALVLAAATPTPRSSQRLYRKSDIKKDNTRGNEDIEDGAAVVLDIFFWVLIVILIIAAIAGIVAR